MFRALLNWASCFFHWMQADKVHVIIGRSADVTPSGFRTVKCVRTVEATLKDPSGQRAKISVNLYIAKMCFHGDEWLMVTFLHSFSESCKAYTDLFGADPTFIGDFGGIQQLDNGNFAICRAMKEFRLDMRSIYFASQNSFFKFICRVNPFDPDFYAVAVHPNAMIVFHTCWLQTILLQVLCTELGFIPRAPRYWPLADNSLILEERGRWRSRTTLMWLKQHGYDSVPAIICSELMALQRSCFAQETGWYVNMELIALTLHVLHLPLIGSTHLIHWDLCAFAVSRCPQAKRGTCTFTVSRCP